MTNGGGLSLRDDASGVTQSGRVARCDPFDVGLVGADAYAGREVVRLDLRERRHDLFARLNRPGAARVEAAALRRVYRRGHVALQDDAPARRLDDGVGDGDGGDERLRVRHQGVAVDDLRVREVDEVAQIHDGHAGLDVAYWR